VLINANDVPAGQALQTDVCIIGAGAAGITLANALTSARMSVLLLESGGFNADPDTLALNRGINVGVPYYPLDECRLRFFGGTTNHWGGWCLTPLESEFSPKDWIPHGSWPVTAAELVPYYERALPILDLGPNNFSGEYWATKERPQFPLDPNKLLTVITQFSPPTRFGTKFRQALVDAKNVSVCLHANAVGFDVNVRRTQATRLRAMTLDRKEFSISARRFVLAAGGIENPRLLLMSTNQGGPGVGNENDLVGRFFADHYMCEMGELHLANGANEPSLYLQHRSKGEQPIKGYLKPGMRTLRERKMTSMQVRLASVRNKRYDDAARSDGITSLAYLLDEMKQRRLPDQLVSHIGNILADLDDVALTAYRQLRYEKFPIDYYSMGAFIEPAPNPDSRVTLTNERDSLGLPVVKLDWRLSEIDWHSFQQIQQIVAAEFGRAAVGRVKLYEYKRDEWPPLDRGMVSGGWHHMGTTRMAADAKQGVVDVNCKIHGIDNVYVAGSSIFPTFEGQPTVSIVAFALRLADHLKSTLKT